MTDEQVWKRRFFAFLLVRLSGLFVIGLGMAVAFTGLVHPGGWQLGGAGLIALGTIEAALGPLLLRKRWSKDQ